jgi:glycosyltransferase involved in cell wall biosynthesis
MPEPFVSCIMPTRNRRGFVRQSITCFLRQDYAARELIIVDDGVDPVADLVPHDARFRYIRLAERRSLGARRNLGVQASRGDLIAHWDDDDWMAPVRLSRQVQAIAKTGALVSGLSSVFAYRPVAAAAGVYHAAGTPAEPLLGCTLVYRRSVWSRQPYLDVGSREDRALLRGLEACQIHDLADPSLYVAVLHDGRLGAADASNPRLTPHPLAPVLQMLGLDRDFYVQLRTGKATPSVPDRTDAASITLVAPFDVCSGYGSMAELLALGMARAGARVHPLPLVVAERGLMAETRALIHASRPSPSAPVLFFHWPSAEFHQHRAADNLFVNTMWESNRLPGTWAEALNHARAVIVPTRFVAHTCRSSGVTTPVVVVPEGIDPTVYHYLERPERAGLTTLMVGPVVDRKNAQLGIDAWKCAFGADPHVRLIIKTSYGYANYTPDDPRIEYVDQREEQRGIAHWYARADVLLALGNEGFGLPLVEAMATGLPAVALNSEGQRDVCQDCPEGVLAVPAVRWPSYTWAGQECGTRGEPSVADIAERLQWVDEHRGEARAIGRAASTWAIENRDVWRKAPRVLEVMEQYVHPPRPLRRLETVWTPSWQTECGISEYTQHLVSSMPSTRVVSRVTDLAGVALLHVQHHPDLVQQSHLEEQLTRARSARVPVVVTEHAITSQRHAWEGSTSAIVSLTASGAEMLARKCPATKIEHIPPGCPTWFPRRKRTRGKTIGTYGFMGRHKGYLRLVDALKSIPGSDLLIYSYVKYPYMRARWEAAIEGQPVRWIEDYRAEADVAHDLAAEADVLVFWYDEARYVSASIAVRTGLASGVPVLTSPTRWFQDVRGVTHQPVNLVEGLERLLEDTTLRDTLTEAATDYCHRHAWSKIADRHRALYRAVRAD